MEDSMPIQRFSRTCSSSFAWSGGRCVVDVTSDSFDTAGVSTSSSRRSRIGGGGASVDVTIDTTCNFVFRGRSVAPEGSSPFPQLRARWVDPIPALAGSPFSAPADAYAGLSAFLSARAWQLSPDCREFAFRFISEQAEGAARRAVGLRHRALALRATLKVVSFLNFDDGGPDGAELVFWEEEEAGAGEGACAVCLEEMEEGKTVARLRCGHAFDAFCISRWLERRKQCPLCRSYAEVLA